MTPTATALLGMTLDAITAEVDRRIIADRDLVDVPILEDLDALQREGLATADPAMLHVTIRENADRLMSALPPHRRQRLAQRIHDEALRHEWYAKVLLKHMERNDTAGAPTPAFVTDVAVLLDAWPSTPPIRQ